MAAILQGGTNTLTAFPLEIATGHLLTCSHLEHVWNEVLKPMHEEQHPSWSGLASLITLCEEPQTAQHCDSTKKLSCTCTSQDLL